MSFTDASDWDPTAVPGAHLVAEEWVNAAKAIKANVPSAADLASMITGIGADFTMQGAPVLVVNLSDEDFILLDSGFLDPADKGTLDRIDIQYGVRPTDGEPYHWRIFQVSPKADFSIETHWIPRVVGELMSIHGPLSASRSRRTRAEFLKMCATKVPYARFHCKQLDKVQPIASVQIPVSSSVSTKNALKGKKVGISQAGMNDNALTVQGKTMGDVQRQNASTLLRVADTLGAGKIATEALIYAAIWESNMEALTTPNSDNKVGILQGSAGIWSGTDVSGMAKAFLLGDSAKGFQAGGAIALSATVNNPIEIAVRVEVPSTWPNNAYAQESGYPGDQQALAEVDAIIEAGGGATGPGGVAGAAVEPVQQYNFSIGTPQDPKEDYWTGMNRLAQEVNWELVVDGDDIYYDSDVTLCRAEIAAVVDRTAEYVTDWHYDWNRTQLPTNFSLVLQCEMFDFKPADVLQLKNFGPASAGSSIGLPGRWLVGEVSRSPGDIVSTLTLIQPTKPLKEPAPQLGFQTTTKPGQVTLTGKGVNPFALATGLKAERVDDGKDYSMAVGSQILAPFDSMFLGVRPWGGAAGNQPYMAFQIVGGTYNGWAYYLAEQIDPATFKVNQIIKAGTVIATYAAVGTGIEMGLANPKNWSQTLAQANGHGGEAPSPEGTRWEAILKALGAPV